MKPKSLVLCALALAVASTYSAAAKEHGESVLYSFHWGKDWGFPASGLTADAQGNLYGTSYHIVYELKRRTKGWSFRIISKLEGIGFSPSAVVFDGQGNLFGTTEAGGSGGCGTVFELVPRGDGTWETRLVHAFNALPDRNGDGCAPSPTAAPAFDAHGNLFGTTVKGGGGDVGGTFCDNGCGSVWEISPTAGGGWKETVLHGFTGEQGNTDGQHPYGSVGFDSRGNLWGTTYVGGTGGVACNKSGVPPGCGTVFELTQVKKGEWKETFLYSFQDAGTGWQPQAGPTIDANDNVYGQFINGGTDKNGVEGNGGIFKLTPQAGGGFAQSVAHSFAPCSGSKGCRDGIFAANSLTLDASGNLFGTTFLGGGANFNCSPNSDRPTGCGIVFKMTPNADGGLDERILYRFREDEDGGEPQAVPLVVDAKGHIFGTTVAGGDLSCSVAQSRGCGTVFEVK